MYINALMLCYIGCLLLYEQTKNDQTINAWCSYTCSKCAGPSRLTSICSSSSSSEPLSESSLSNSTLTAGMGVASPLLTGELLGGGGAGEQKGQQLLLLYLVTNTRTL